MEFVKFAREYKRMCKTIHCADCDILALKNARESCSGWCMKNPEQAEKIVQKWAMLTPML